MCFSGEGEVGRGHLWVVLVYEFCYGCVAGGVSVLVCICVEFAELCCCVTVSGCVLCWWCS